MEKIKNILNKFFNIEFLLKILIITIIITIMNGRFKFEIMHDVNVHISSGYGGIEIKIKE